MVAPLSDPHRVEVSPSMAFSGAFPSVSAVPVASTAFTGSFLTSSPAIVEIVFLLFLFSTVVSTFAPLCESMSHPSATTSSSKQNHAFFAVSELLCGDAVAEPKVLLLCATCSSFDRSSWNDSSAIAAVIYPPSVETPPTKS